MTPTPRPSPPRRLIEWAARHDGATAVAVGVAATVAAVLLLGLIGQRLSVPLSLGRDASLVQFTAQGIIEGNWYYENPRVSAPFEFSGYDFPDGGHVQFALFKVAGWLTGGDLGLTINLSYLATFLGVGAVAYWVLRRLSVRAPWAAALAILYALLPFHETKGVGHFYLSLYVAAPLAVLLAVRQIEGPAAFVVAGEGGTRLRLSPRHGPTRVALVAALAIGLTGGYYAVMTGVILAVVALAGFIANRDPVRLLSTMLVAASIAVVLGIALLPTLVYRLEHGPNPRNVAVRLYHESDYYALRPLHLVLPIPEHRIEQLRGPMYRSQQGTHTEVGQNLGVVGAVGLVALAGSAAATLIAGSDRASRRIRVLAGLAAAIVMIGVVGGVSAGLGLVGFTVLRAWARIVVFLGFVSLAALGWWLSDRWRWSRAAAWGAAALLVLLGGLDQTPTATGFAARSAEWDSSAGFVAEIEHRLPEGAAVYQMPYVPYPEHGSTHRMDDYDHLVGYLHSTDLRWSYPAMRGRVPEWQPGVNALPVPEMVDRLVAVGFSGIWIDRFGYREGTAVLETGLRTLLGGEPLVSPDGRIAFFDLTGAAFDLHSRLSEAEIADLAAITLAD